MFLNSQNKLYFGDCAQGDREATAQEIAAWELSRTPAPLEQIRALEAQYADAQAKVTRQALLALALEKAMQDPAAAGLSQAQVHAVLMSRDNGYQALFTLEQQVAALRSQL